MKMGGILSGTFKQSRSGMRVLVITYLYSPVLVKERLQLAVKELVAAVYFVEG